MKTSASPEARAIAGLMKAQMSLRGMTQAQVSRESGIGTSQLSRIFNGTKSMEFDEIQDICRAIGADVQAVITRGIQMASQSDPDNFSIVENGDR